MSSGCCGGLFRIPAAVCPFDQPYQPTSEKRDQGEARAALQAFKGLRFDLIYQGEPDKVGRGDRIRLRRINGGVVLTWD